MSNPRIYQTQALKRGDIVVLDDKASHHLARVLRINLGEAITLFNGDGHEYSAIITQITKKQVHAEVQSVTERNVESPLNITLAQGIARGEKMDFIIQKAVELGVDVIQPLITERCNVRMNQEREQKRLQHWQSVIVSACEQCGRNTLPQLTLPLTLLEWISKVSAERKFVLSPYAQQTLPAQHEAIKSVALLIGPEGGLTTDEINLSKQHHFEPLKLGPRILRTETATITALSILQSHYGDLK